MSKFNRAYSVEWVPQLSQVAPYILFRGIIKLEETFEDEFRAIESSIIGIYRNNPELVDSQVERAVNASIGLHNAALKGVTPKQHSLSGLELEVFESMQQLNSSFLQGEPAIMTVNELLGCLKRLRKSVQRWNKQLGRQGYLTFVSQFL